MEATRYVGRKGRQVDVESPIDGFPTACASILTSPREQRLGRLGAGRTCSILSRGKTDSPESLITARLRGCQPEPSAGDRQRLRAENGWFSALRRHRLILWKLTRKIVLEGI